jgi:hypothetical protein
MKYTVYDIKDLREKPYMLFGSLCNYLSRIHKEPMTEEEIAKLFKLCCELVRDYVDDLKKINGENNKTDDPIDALIMEDQETIEKLFNN